MPFIQQTDGRRSIREISECALVEHGLPQAGRAELKSFVRHLFKALWRVDLVAMALPTVAHGDSAADGARR